MFGKDTSSIVHRVGRESTLWKLLNEFLGAYKDRTEKLSKPSIGETSIAQKLDAIIEMLRPLGVVPSQLGLVENRLEIIHGLVLDLQNPPSQPKSPEVRFMFVVKDDNADVNFSLVLGDVTDAEGNVIADAALDVAIGSDNPDVVSITFDQATRSGSAHFGGPGVATIAATVSSGGAVLGSGAASFTVTTGDPAAISGVSLNFEGLTEV